MIKQSPQVVRLPRPAAQLPMAFTTRVVLDAKQQADIVSLLSRLLFQAASTASEQEVDDEHA